MLYLDLKSWMIYGFLDEERELSVVNIQDFEQQMG
jgi:hypothetical protein